MATYVIGDVHGCHDSLQRLLARCAFDPERDRLWLVGDLVNRGPDSLAVLRWARSMSDRLGERMVVVLGNHDVHLLGVLAGVIELRAKDDLGAILAAPDRHDLAVWLRGLPLLHREDDALLVHAGLRPSWTPEEAEGWARCVEEQLRSDNPHLLRRRPPSRRGDHRLWSALDAFIRLRTCTRAGEPCDHKGPPEDAPPGCLPWFRVPGRRTADVTVLCGHWSALRLHREPEVIMLDDGAAWGGNLCALRLADGPLDRQSLAAGEILRQPVTETRPASD